MAGADLRDAAEGITFDRDKRVSLRTTGDVGLGVRRPGRRHDPRHERGRLRHPAVGRREIVNNTLLDRINQHTLEQMLDNLKLILESDD